MEAPLYNNKGEKKGKVNLDSPVFTTPWNESLVSQVVLAMADNSRLRNAHTKDRSEVRGGGKKPWQQKGLGRARHGSNRSPIWVGGGVTFGPRSRSVERKVNRKMKAKALYSVLSKKLVDENLLFVDALTIKEPKTREILSKIDAIRKSAGKEGKRVLIVAPEYNKMLVKSISNIPKVDIITASGLQARNALAVENMMIVAPEEVTTQLEARYK